jgi:hypothetical protein
MNKKGNTLNIESSQACKDDHGSKSGIEVMCLFDETVMRNLRVLLFCASQINAAPLMRLISVWNRPFDIGLCINHS